MDVLLTVAAGQLNRYWYGSGQRTITQPAANVRPVLLRLVAAIVAVSAWVTLLTLVAVSR